MNPIQKTARLAGLLYLAFAILAILGYMYIPGSFIVPGDASATARRITENATLYRLGIAVSLLSQIVFVALALRLYELFEDVDRSKARFLAALVCVGATAEIVNLANRVAPLVLLSGADFLSAFTRAQQDALALSFLRLGSHLGQMLTAFWGLWLFPFGLLTIRSGYFPRALGVLLLVSGVAYIGTCVVGLVFPVQFQVIAPIVTPLYLGEVAMVLWLPLVGARVPRSRPDAPCS